MDSLIFCRSIQRLLSASPIARSRARVASRFLSGIVISLLASSAPAQTHHEHGSGAHGAAGAAGAMGAMSAMSAMSRSPKAVGELGASAAFDTAGKLWVVHKQEGAIAVSASSDLGQTWTAPVRVTARPEPTDTGGDARPKIAVAPNGAIFVTWTRPLGKPYTGEIRFSRSTDGGGTFSPPRVVHADRQVITHRFDSIAIDTDGMLYVAWIDKRDGVAAPKGEPYPGAAVYYAVSSDGGETFRGDYRLGEHSCECCRIALAPLPGGGMLALWRHVFAPNIRDHAIATMQPDGRASPVQRATFDDWRVDVCPHHGPSLALDASGRRHATWFTMGSVRSGVFYGRLESGRVDGLRQVGTDAAEHADLAVTGNRVAIAWKEFDGQKTRLEAMVSDDGGATWRASATLASTASATDQPRVLVNDGRFFVFWNTREFPLTIRELK